MRMCVCECPLMCVFASVRLKACFGERRDMIRHKNAVHFGIKNKSSVWNCPECDILFKLRRDYDKHKAAYHSELNEEQIVKFLNSEMEAKQKQKFSINLVQIDSNRTLIKIG